MILTDFFFLADSLHLGDNPAQEIRCLSSTKTFIFVPISAIINIAESSFIPGTVKSKLISVLNFMAILSICSSNASIHSLIES